MSPGLGAWAPLPPRILTQSSNATSPGLGLTGKDPQSTPGLGPAEVGLLSAGRGEGLRDPRPQLNRGAASTKGSPGGRPSGEVSAPLAGRGEGQVASLRDQPQRRHEEEGQPSSVPQDP